MTSNALMRLSSAHAYDGAVKQLSQRQLALSSLQENLTAGKKVLHASDDPAAAAQAERALTRLARIQTDQRALASQRNAIASAESTLGDAVNALQAFRELVVSAGNPAYGAQQRQTIAQQLTGLRDQIFTLANTRDTNGLPLFSALGSALAPFVQPSSPPPDYLFNGVPGQTSSSDVAIPFTLDGDRAFMFKPAQDGSFDVSYSANLGQSSTSPVALTNPSAVTGNNYQISFTSVLGVTQYTVNQIAPAAVVVPATNFVPGAAIAFDGLSLSVTGKPQVGDVIDIKPNTSIFAVLDHAAANIAGAGNNAAAAQAVGQALANIDIGLDRLQAARGQAGDLLSRAERIGATQESRSIQLEADRSRAEDMDMVQGISDFQNQQTGYDAALRSYAQIQKLSLFNYLG